MYQYSTYSEHSGNVQLIGFVLQSRFGQKQFLVFGEHHSGQSDSRRSALALGHRPRADCQNQDRPFSRRRQNGLKWDALKLHTLFLLWKQHSKNCPTSHSQANVVYLAQARIRRHHRFAVHGIQRC